MAVNLNNNRNTIHGLRRGSIQWTDDFKSNEDDKGVITVTQSFYCYNDEYFTVAPKKGSPCKEPGWQNLELTKLNIEEVKSGIAKVSCTYSFLNESNTFTFNDSQDYYESSITTSEEPLATHNNYKDISAADMEALQGAKNGSWIKEDGSYKFTSLSNDPSTEAPKEVTITDTTAIELWDNFYAKDIDVYLAVHQTFRKTTYRRTLPSAVLKNVGKIDTPPGAAPSLDDDKNWLYAGATITRQAAYYVITQEWIASGSGGWSSIIY